MWRTDGQTDGRTDPIMAYTAVSIASYADGCKNRSNLSVRTSVHFSYSPNETCFMDRCPLAVCFATLCTQSDFRVTLYSISQSQQFQNASPPIGKQPKWIGISNLRTRLNISRHPFTKINSPFSHISCLQIWLKWQLDVKISYAR